MKSSIALALVCLIGVESVLSFSLTNPFSGVLDPITKTNEVNKKLCEPGTHSDEVAKKFDACYDDATGGAQYITCQMKVYGHKMDTEANIDDVCNSNKFVPYASCVVFELTKAMITPYAAAKSLVECQGPVLGIDV